ncbi:tRNA1(Val) (adenine(37)-N6)-methyltransferase [Mycoplasma sp. 1654_15]|uniref:tRNA1(Val) (adenine(37)-N6)-methyltransferase n=1 Tax=Mycoplasma sp. 1654_15 TaxID=2725994 RepID=UPI0014497C78|nr:tRNA1(Val) (adenine(37)-N6)-methyltransferase [Mycoplasma sp. 1654_15]QJB71263.1 tRNA1(Val) (adenine(37)-N6)-methyltransferase [Mycoplasma sp. 1654_15]
MIKDKNVVKNSLGFDSNLFVYQDKTMFNYSVDTIMLGNFISLSKKTKNLLEIGTNNAALAIFVAERDKDLKIDAIDIEPKAIDLAKKNVILNKKEAQINLIAQDFNDFWKEHTKAQKRKYDLIFTNPPYYKLGTKNIKNNISEQVKKAIYEISINLEQIILGSSKIIQQKGILSMVLPTERFVDAIELLRKYKFEPKKIQFIFARIDTKPSFVLIESAFAATWGTHYLPNLYLHPKNKKLHVYRKEIKKLYKPIKRK